MELHKYASALESQRRRAKKTKAGAQGAEWTTPSQPSRGEEDTALALGMAGDVPVEWTSSTDPDRFTVSASWSCGTGCWTGVPFELPGSARAFTIPSAALPSGQVHISVFAYRDGAFSGDYLPRAGYHGMNLRAARGGVAIQR